MVLQRCPYLLNSRDPRGQTPLHLAVALRRPDVVALLLAQPAIDDMQRDHDGLTCTDVPGADPDVVQLVTVSRAQFHESYVSLLGAYIESPSKGPEQRTSNPGSVGGPSSSSSKGAATPVVPSTSLPAIVSAKSGHVSNEAAEKLYHLVAQPRASSLDFATRHPAHGTTVLHEAVRRKDLGLIKLVIARGGDVLAKDKRGKIPAEIAKDERLRAVLQDAAQSEAQALRAANQSRGAPGIAALSQTQTQPHNLGAPPAMRGYLSKWTNLARGYRTRWFVLDNGPSPRFLLPLSALVQCVQPDTMYLRAGMLSYYRSQEDEGKASRGAINMAVARVSTPGQDKLKFEVSSKLGKTFPSFFLKGSHPVEVMRWVDVLRHNVDAARDSVAPSKSNTSSYASSVISNHDERASRRTGAGAAPDAADKASPPESSGSVIGDDETFNGDAEHAQPPHADDFEMLAHSAQTQLDLSVDLVGSLAAATDPAERSEVEDALRSSLNSLRSMLEEYVGVVKQRETHFVRKYEREIDAKRLWEENMKAVAAQQAVIEEELQKVGRDNTRRKKALQEVRASIFPGSPFSPVTSPDGTAGPPLDLAGVTSSGSQDDVALTPRQSRSATVTSPSRLRGKSISRALQPHELNDLLESALVGEADSDSDESDEEFFEAIESGAINLPTESEALPQQPVDCQQEFLAQVDRAPYVGYENVRHRLPLESDNRPPASLWAILKGSIGKDLTKIRFPVYFNEPTSMLQRMAEDLEFPECLDRAAGDPDPAKRLAFVAAFAMSNYSSTIGRIAKPFNPLLSETFEYVEPKKCYRYISEQVSHHPPISACIAQSPAWEYFGEVDAKNNFTGKSFEIKPTGIAHAKLRIPMSWGDDLPPAPRKTDMGIEHFSWNKVTTCVSNFLFGNPIIDHYGDMVVTNHNNGYKCTLTFKPRGWRGSGACEIKGKVVDANGRELLDIAGKWSSQLVARRVGAGSGDLKPDAPMPSSEDDSEYFLLWKNSDKPPGMPFNLTPYAITLNDDNPEIKHWLPPTDCRLRPDQHAFERGEFERANQLKSALEDWQRETRKKRETGELPPHKPRWFARKKEADTGELYWEPARLDTGDLEYWSERERVGREKKDGKDTDWRGVEPIYPDEGQL